MTSIIPMRLRALSALLGLGAALNAQADIYTYPATDAPCNTTLQACVNGVNAADSIELHTDNHINEDVVIAKDLELRAAPGRRPSVRTVTARASTDSAQVRVDGLTSFNGASRVRGVLNPGGGDLVLYVVNSQLLGTALDSALSIVTSNNAGSYGTAYLYAEGNTISQSGTNDYCAPAIQAIGLVSRLSIDIFRNDVLATSLGQCAAISLYNGSPDLLSARVHNNTVRGNGADAGIMVRSGSRQMQAVVAGNLVAGGFDAGLRVSADNTNTVATVNLLNNTVVGTQHGLIASARSDLGADITGVVANNVFARHPVFGMLIGDLPRLLDHHNLVFASPQFPGTRPYGPNTRHGNPSFANEAGADYRLRANSDAIDHGDDGAVESTHTLDLDGQPRRVRVVDMGAYEFQGTPMPRADGPITPVPATGPWALGWGAALLALVAGARLRRRR
ncbi:MAG: choice-of-anchor Q domain-containing protein [Ottowia sp.]|uniref:choice-of-anchor Q domain-containing protein n=1 Tax=Ottowia sp. TaxID=1898956 RepID=UPI0039E59E71